MRPGSRVGLHHGEGGAGVTPATAAATLHDMSTPPDQPPPPSPPEKPKMSAEERRIRQEDRLASIRLRMAIGHELDDRGITKPADIGEALGMPAAEAVKLLTRHQWREGDVALLEAAAARLGVRVPAMTGV
jgi:predicted component of type VI protein secretion system